MAKKNQEQGFIKTNDKSLDFELASGCPGKLNKPTQEEISKLALLYRDCRFDDAVSFASSLLQNFEPTDLIYQYYGLSLKGLGRYRESIDLFYKAIMLNPDNIEAHNNNGLVLEILGDLEGAKQSFRKTILIDKNFAEGHHNLGLSLKCIGENRAAIESYARAIEINPKYFVAHNNLGNALSSLGKLEESIKSYRRAIKINPNFAEAYFNMGNVFRSLHLPKKAIGSYRIALKNKPDFAEAHNYLGATLNIIGETRNGIKEFEKAIQLKPDYAEAHNNLGKAFYYIGKIEDSLNAYDKAVFHKADYAEAYYNRAVLLFHIGRNKESIKDYMVALDINPKYSEAHYGLGNAWNLIGEKKKALTNYNKAIQINPKHLSSKYMVASLTGKTVLNAPKEYICNLFDNFAGKFDNFLIQKLNYKGPEHLVDLFVKEFGHQMKYSIALDIGCGTGLAGKAFRPYVHFMIGIDLSTRMIERAKEKRIYDELVVEDFSKVLWQSKRIYDLFICADIFIYFGDLAEIFQSLQNRSREKSLLIFSTEHFHGEGFSLSRFGRFAHSRNYIQSLIDLYGFELISFKTGNLRNEGTKWVEGGFYLARRIHDEAFGENKMVA